MVIVTNESKEMSSPRMPADRWKQIPWHVMLRIGEYLPTGQSVRDMFTTKKARAGHEQYHTTPAEDRRRQYLVHLAHRRRSKTMEQRFDEPMLPLFPANRFGMPLGALIHAVDLRAVILEQRFFFLDVLSPFAPESARTIDSIRAKSIQNAYRWGYPECAAAIEMQWGEFAGFFEAQDATNRVSFLRDCLAGGYRRSYEHLLERFSDRSPVLFLGILMQEHLSDDLKQDAVHFLRSAGVPWDSRLFPCAFARSDGSDMVRFLIALGCPLDGYALLMCLMLSNSAERTRRLYASIRIMLSVAEIKKILVTPSPYFGFLPCVPIIRFLTFYGHRDIAGELRRMIGEDHMWNVAMPDMRLLQRFNAAMDGVAIYLQIQTPDLFRHLLTTTIPRADEYEDMLRTRPTRGLDADRYVADVAALRLVEHENIVNSKTVIEIRLMASSMDPDARTSFYRAVFDAAVHKINCGDTSNAPRAIIEAMLASVSQEAIARAKMMGVIA